MSSGGPPFRSSRDLTGADLPEAGAPERSREAPARLPRAPQCPFCSGSDTELMSAFGSHASVSTYWCRACRSPFELVKWRSG